MDFCLKYINFFIYSDTFIAVGGVEGIVYIFDTGKLNIRNKLIINVLDIIIIGRNYENPK